jgi:hypothetical protein
MCYETVTDYKSQFASGAKKKRIEYKLVCGYLYRPQAGISNPEGSIFRPFPYVKTSGDFSFRFPV